MNWSHRNKEEEEEKEKEEEEKGEGTLQCAQEGDRSEPEGAVDILGQDTLSSRQHGTLSKHHKHKHCVFTVVMSDEQKALGGLFFFFFFFLSTKPSDWLKH